MWVGWGGAIYVLSKERRKLREGGRERLEIIGMLKKDYKSFFGLVTFNETAKTYTLNSAISEPDLASIPCS